MKETPSISDHVQIFSDFKMMSISFTDSGNYNQWPISDSRRYSHEKIIFGLWKSTADDLFRVPFADFHDLFWVFTLNLPYQCNSAMS